VSQNVFGRNQGKGIRRSQSFINLFFAKVNAILEKIKRVFFFRRGTVRFGRFRRAGI